VEKAEGKGKKEVKHGGNKTARLQRLAESRTPKGTGKNGGCHVPRSTGLSSGFDGPKGCGLSIDLQQGDGIDIRLGR
jgi:hypothetical protein